MKYTFQLPPEIKELLQKHADALVGFSKTFEKADSKELRTESEFARLSEEILNDERTISPEDTKALAVLATKREQRDAFSRELEKLNDAKLTSKLSAEIAHEMNSARGVICRAALVVMESYCKQIVDLLMPFCPSLEAAKGYANTLPAVVQFGTLLHAQQIIGVSSARVITNRGKLVELLLSGEIEFVYKGAQF